MTTPELAPCPSSSFRADVLAGLSRPRKRLPSKYLYDAAGSTLFDQITRLPEYYPTRTELGILGKYAGQMARHCGPRSLIVELGAGNLTKVRSLLNHLDRPAGYVPVDVSDHHLHAAVADLSDDFPELAVVPVVADFSQPFRLPNVAAARRVVFFPGSTIGNFDPPETDALLRQIARLVGSGGGLIIGIDLRKDIAVLERAYNDAAGVTVRFNRNLLVRINRELDGNLDPARFRHVAFYNRARSRIEMHLVSTRAQQVQVAGAAFEFGAGESIHTENSYKYCVADFAARVLGCGLRLVETWTDPRKYFAVLYLTGFGSDGGFP
jgi:dimethylhistidine N-methyltransferase